MAIDGVPLELGTTVFHVIQDIYAPCAATIAAVSTQPMCPRNLEKSILLRAAGILVFHLLQTLTLAFGLHEEHIPRTQQNVCHSEHS